MPWRGLFHSVVIKSVIYLRGMYLANPDTSGRLSKGLFIAIQGE